MRPVFYLCEDGMIDNGRDINLLLAHQIVYEVDHVIGHASCIVDKRLEANMRLSRRTAICTQSPSTS